ncbi:hypothetical protein E1A91_A03G078800v1, partial [Gossypium mustelinum]
LRELIQLLRVNVKKFTWTIANMLGIDPSTIMHSFNVDCSTKLIKQKNRKLSKEKIKSVSIKVNKLIASSFFQKVTYLNWVSNVVIVKKSNDN